MEQIDRSQFTGIAKILDYPNDRVNVMINRNASEYTFNEANLRKSALRIIKKENWTLFEVKEEETREYYINLIQKLNEKYEKYYYYSGKFNGNYDNSIEDKEYINFETGLPINEYLIETKLSPDDVKKIQHDINNYITIHMKSHDKNINDQELINKLKIFYTNKLNFNKQIKIYDEEQMSAIKSIQTGDFDEVRTLIINKKDDLFRQLMKWRESRLTPKFKNSLDILTKKSHSEDVNNMITQLYDIFYKNYKKQIYEDFTSNFKKYIKDPEAIQNINNKLKQQRSIEFSISQYDDFFNFLESIPFNDKDALYIQSIFDELENTHIQSISPINLKDLITIDGCPYHHKFVNEKLHPTSYRIVYLSDVKKISCDPKYIDYKINGYKKNLIREFLSQQEKGLTAPIPIQPKPIEETFDEKDIYNEEINNNSEEINNNPIVNDLEVVENSKIEVVNNQIYNKSFIHETIVVPFRNMGKNIESYFVKYARDQIEGKCRNEGYIRKNSCKVITHTSGLLNTTSVVYNVIFLCEVFVPYHNMTVECYIKNKTKLGFVAILSDTENPATIYISKEHHKFDLDELPVEDGDKLIVSIVGYHFEKNDETISAFGLLNAG